MYDAVIFTGATQYNSKPAESSPIVFDTFVGWRSLGAYRIRTELESKGYSVKVIDYFHCLTDEDIEEIFKKYVSKKTLWVGFSTTFLNTTVLLKNRSDLFLRLRNQYNVSFVIGGAKSLVEDLEFADIFISGYADNAIVAVTDLLAGKDVDMKWRDYKGKKHIDSNHMYDKKDLSNIGVIWKSEDSITAQQALPIEIARGCIFNCSFCNFPLNNKKKFDYIRVKEDMYEEFMRNYEQFGTTYYTFMDDTYNDSMIKLEIMHEVISRLPFKIKFDAFIKPELLVRWPEQVDLLVETGFCGANLGIESYNPETRASIKKMVDIEKVIDSINNLKIKSNGQVKIQISLIIGLPFEAEESIWITREEVINNPNIDAWNFYPLLIHSKEHDEYLSLIDRDPEKYGYEIKTKRLFASAKNKSASPQNHWMTIWKNEHMTAFDAIRLAEKLRLEDAHLQKVAGWNTGNVTSLGLDVDKHYEEHNGLMDKLPDQFLSTQKHKVIEDYRRMINII
jgi:radical SAM superfamily enzyme YgiQ (UPF0313 family)